MSITDVQVILNELKHIREDMQELKEASKLHDKNNLTLAVFTEKMKDYDEYKKKVEELYSERKALRPIVPWVASAIGSVIAWLAGGGWKIFVG